MANLIQDIEAQIAGAKADLTKQSVGVIREIGDGVARVEGLADAMLNEMLDLGREIKRREADYRSGRATLRSLRDAIARGTRPETLLRDSRAVAIERPAATRPTTTDRPERPVDRPQRPERPVDRPQR